MTTDDRVTEALAHRLTEFTQECLKAGMPPAEIGGLLLGAATLEAALGRTAAAEIVEESAARLRAELG